MHSFVFFSVLECAEPATRIIKRLNWFIVYLESVAGQQAAPCRPAAIADAAQMQGGGIWFDRRLLVPLTKHIHDADTMVDHPDEVEVGIQKQKYKWFKHYHHFIKNNLVPTVKLLNYSLRTFDLTSWCPCPVTVSWYAPGCQYVKNTMTTVVLKKLKKQVMRNH